MLNIAVNGAERQMGRLITETIERSKSCVVSLKCTRKDGIKELSQTNIPVDVFIDFTNPAATMEYLDIARKRGIRVVIGTTGLSDQQKSEVAKAAKDIPIVFSPNMSIGMNITYKLLEMAASILKDNAEVALLDVHHSRKQDAPSGTSLRMKEIIEKASSTNLSNINVASLRIGDAVGCHTALFALRGEQIEITHRATNRTLFAEGALEAAKWLIDQKPGLYDMQDVLGLIGSFTSRT